MKILSNLGFSLIELAIVLLVFAIIASSGLSYLPKKITREQITETNRKLDFIENAISGFVLQNGRLPCPEDKDSKGKEKCKVLNGMVPVAVLQIAKDYTTDAWGNKITYQIIPSYSFNDGNLRLNEHTTIHTNYIANFSNQKKCEKCITITNATGEVTTKNAIMSIRSYGPDGIADDKNKKDTHPDDLLRFKTRAQLILDTRGFNAQAGNTICTTLLKDFLVNNVCNNNKECTTVFQELSDTARKLCF